MIVVEDNLDLFYKRFRELIWLTYRSDFRPLLIEKKIIQGKKVLNMTTDCNWGCTIRAAQMLIANTAMLCARDMTTTEIIQL
jgi:hypothetical protein